MTDKTWKRIEREVARWFPGAKRRGADYGDRNGGKSDIIFPGWSIEVKHNKRPSFSLMQGAVEQAERNRENEGDIPIAVIHHHGYNVADSLVVMRLSEFARYFINDGTTSTEEVTDDEQDF